MTAGVRLDTVHLPRTGAGASAVPRVLFYSHDGYGLGHIRLTLAVAGALGELRPDAAMLILTGSMQAHAYDLPPFLDYVKLPSVERRHLYADLPPHPAADSLPNVWYVRDAVIRTTAAAFSPHLVVVDQTPAGLAGELVPTLAALHETGAPIVLLLRDIVYGPETTRAAWETDGSFDLLDRTYDHILVYGSRDVFDPVREYGFSPEASAKTASCGYIKRQESIVPPERVRADLNVGRAPLVVVTAGGGADGGALLRTYLSALAHGALDGVASFVVTGPFLETAERRELEAIARGLRAVTLTAFCPDLPSHLNAADVVVTMGGYNAVCEAVSLGKRAIVVPRVSGSEEQLIRAERFARRDLITLLHPDLMTPVGLANAVRAELTRGISPPPSLDFGGLPRIAAALAALLGGDRSPMPESDGDPRSFVIR